jgi:transcriptional antiterminator RfaH
MHTTDPAWYCIRTHPKHEHIAAANLRQLPNVEVFNPQLRFLRCTARGRVRSTEPLFPNYLFARFVLEVSLDKIRFTPSVTRVLSFGDRVPSIPDNVITELRHNLADNEQHVFTDVPLQGEEVEIVDGPFQGARAIVTRIMPAKQRVQVLMDVLGQSTVTELNLETVLFEKRQAAKFVLANAEAFPAALPPVQPVHPAIPRSRL